MLIITLLVIGIIAFIIYKRYYPVRGVECGTISPTEQSIEIVDVRDYNQSYKNPIEGSINIPMAYLNRYFSEISKKKIHIVAANHLDMNMSIRFFRQKGFKVIGYTLTDCMER
ncbi:hypothetical protein FZW96_15335 [Bacillus sp. BGMRC 2118]|nr:hypothetical protein FZW96_15335 [Bacillus sp. BGMRC 2118]